MSSKNCHICGEITGFAGGSHPECRDFLTGKTFEEIKAYYACSTYVPGGYDQAMVRVKRLFDLIDLSFKHHTSLED